MVQYLQPYVKSKSVILFFTEQTTSISEDTDTDATYNTFSERVNDARRQSTTTRKATIRDFLTVLALSLHAVFEGLAVGLESDTGKLWTLFAGK